MNSDNLETLENKINPNPQKSEDRIKSLREKMRALKKETEHLLVEKEPEKENQENAKEEKIEPEIVITEEKKEILEGKIKSKKSDSSSSSSKSIKNKKEENNDNNKENIIEIKTEIITENKPEENKEKDNIKEKKIKKDSSSSSSSSINDKNKNNNNLNKDKRKISVSSSSSNSNKKNNKILEIKEDKKENEEVKEKKEIKLDNNKNNNNDIKKINKTGLKKNDSIKKPKPKILTKAVTNKSKLNNSNLNNSSIRRNNNINKNNNSNVNTSYNTNHKASFKFKQNINNTKIDSKPDNINPEPSSRNAKKNMGMKKSVTTYPNKKFNPEEFNKTLESFKEWENKRKERIKQLEKEQR